jgi:5'(3')-deoxyribonucleotidase
MAGRGSSSTVVRMDRLTLAIDIDGVVCDLIGGMRPHAARYLDVPAATLAEPHDYNFTDWGWSADEYDQQLTKAIVEHDLLATLKPYEGAVEALHRLSRVHDLAYVTARAQRPGSELAEVEQTTRWLNNHGLLPAPLHFTTDKNSVSWDVLIDDYPKNIEAATAAGRRVIIFERGWNLGRPGERARDWADVEHLLR